MKLKFSVETMELDDQIIAIPVGDNASIYKGVIKLNETASFILKLLENDVSEEFIVNALKENYDVSSEVIKADVRRFIGELNNRGLLC